MVLSSLVAGSYDEWIFFYLVGNDSRNIYVFTSFTWVFNIVMKTEGLPNDVSGSMANSVEEVQRLDRSTSFSTGLSLIDSSIKMHVFKVILYFFPSFFLFLVFFFSLI